MAAEACSAAASTYETANGPVSGKAALDQVTRKARRLISI